MTIFNFFFTNTHYFHGWIDLGELKFKNDQYLLSPLDPINIFLSNKTITYCGTEILLKNIHIPGESSVLKPLHRQQPPCIFVSENIIIW